MYTPGRKWGGLPRHTKRARAAAQAAADSAARAAADSGGRADTTEQHYVDVAIALSLSGTTSLVFWQLHRFVLFNVF